MYVLFLQQGLGPEFAPGSSDDMNTGDVTLNVSLRGDHGAFRYYFMILYDIMIHPVLPRCIHLSNPSCYWMRTSKWSSGSTVG